MLSRVVLPLPEGPSSTTTSRSAISRSTWFSALTCNSPRPYALVRALAVKMGCVMALAGKQPVSSSSASRSGALAMNVREKPRNGARLSVVSLPDEIAFLSAVGDAPPGAAAGEDHAIRQIRIERGIVDLANH